MMKNCYVGVKGIVRVGDSVLVLKKRTPELAYWDLPGGRVEGSENLEETLRRELKEEVPFLKEYTIGNVVSACRLPFDLDNGTGLVLVFFLVQAQSVNVGELPEHEGYVWVNRENIQLLLNSEHEIQPKQYEALIQALELG